MLIYEKRLIWGPLDKKPTKILVLEINLNKNEEIKSMDTNNQRSRIMRKEAFQNKIIKCIINIAEFLERAKSYAYLIKEGELLEDT